MSRAPPHTHRTAAPPASARPGLRYNSFFQSHISRYCTFQVLYVCGAQTSSRAIFVCTVRTIHQRNPEATRFPTMCNTCAAAQSKTVRTGLTFCHSVRHVYSCTLCTTVPGHTVVYPVCGEYQAGAACRLQTAVPRTEKMSAQARLDLTFRHRKPPRASGLRYI
jgi:hypothetical protein